MAEAVVDSRSTSNSKFFCHKCSTEISPVLPEFTCPNCHGGFIEEVEENEEERTSDSDDVHVGPGRSEVFDSARVFSSLWSQLGGPENRYSSDQASGSSNATNLPHSNNTNTAGSNPIRLQAHPQFGSRGSRFTIQRMGHRGDPAADMVTILQHLLGLGNQAAQVPGGLSFPVHMLNLHGNPRDYAWGEGGLDAIITQLLNNVDGQGPSPASSEDISKLKVITINNEHIENGLECPVCKDDFKDGQRVKEMPCKHLFHPECIVTWLELHNSCPVCRKSVDGHSTEKDIAMDGNGSSDSTPAAF